MMTIHQDQGPLRRLAPRAQDERSCDRFQRPALWSLSWTAAVLLLLACAEPPTTPEVHSHDMAAQTTKADAPDAPGHVERIADPSHVCMVNDQFMGAPQIPVVVSDRTYYGCCEMCEKKLLGSASARTGTDPLSGEAVDKATAVLARTSRGAVLYFASEQNLLAYAAAPR